MTPSEPQTGESSSRAVFKNILGSSGLYSLTLVGQRLAGIALVPLYTHYLTQSDYGTLELLDQVVSILSILLGANFSSSLAFFYFRKDSEENRRAASSTTIGGSALIGILAGGTGWILSGFLSRVVFGGSSYVPYLRIVFGGLVLSFVLEATLSWLRVTDRSGAYSLAAVARMAVQIIVALVLLMAFRRGVTGVLVSNVGASGVVTAGLLIFFTRLVSWRFDVAMFGRMLKFAVPLGFSGAALFMIHFGDRFFIRNYRSLADVGIYGLAYKIGMLISFVHASFHTYWSAQVYHLVKREDGEIVFARAFTYMVAALSLCALGLTVAARPGVRILTTPAYAGAAQIVPIIVSAYFVRAIGDFFRVLFYVGNRPVYDTVCNWIGAAVCIAGYFLLIPKYGMTGAALSTLISFGVIGIIVIPWTYRLAPFRLETRRLLKIGVAAAAPLCLFFLVPVAAPIAQIAWGCLLIAIFPAILLAIGFATPGERSVAISALSRMARSRIFGPGS